jgi:hypothetical protein
MKMKAFLAIVALACAVIAFPSPSDGNETEVNTNYLIQNTPSNCEPGLDYCFEQIVRDLGALLSFSPIIRLPGSIAAQHKSLLKFFFPRRRETKNSAPILRPRIQKRRAVMSRLQEMAVAARLLLGRTRCVELGV